VSLHVRASPPENWQWLVGRTGCALSTDFSAIEAVDAKGRIWGMVGYCNRTTTAVQMHMAVDAPIAWRRLLRPGLEYPFLQDGRKVLLGVIAASNPKSLRFAKAVGFTEAWRLKDGAATGDDLVFLTLRREDCRHLPKEALHG
jgi:RimJ/RimL family protein N-acetyltransferase